MLDRKWTLWHKRSVRTQNINHELFFIVLYFVLLLFTYWSMADNDIILMNELSTYQTNNHYHRINQLSTNIIELNAKFFRSSRPGVFCKDGFFCKIHRKSLVLEFLLNKIVGQGLATSKRHFDTGFSSGFTKFLRTPFLWSYITLVNNVSHDY